MSKLNLVHLKNVPIYEQLQLEEALLRLTGESWCVINEGSPPAIVMGISGKFEQLVDEKKIANSPIPLIKRYSGGGTIVVDNDTLFVSFIMQKNEVPISPFPEPILRWSANLYKKALNIPGFSLKENDYVIGMRKCGGNAQYIKKEAFVHHTTFLWNFQTDLMDYLLHPPKTPKYRAGRTHHDFLCSLKEFFPSKAYFIAALKSHLKAFYTINERDLNPLLPLLIKPHRKATSLIIPCRGS
ncbi:MAG: lipoate--protein ligase family protein [Chlamydiia bacterium]|nr:lipoate--protein ligase family protein [Chlamydiia bacterium]